jgi:hypothetical protein
MSVPKISDDRWDVPVGPSYNAKSLENGRYHALLMSQTHHRLPNGGWSGGGPFYCWKRSIIHSTGRFTARWHGLLYDNYLAGVVGGGFPSTLGKPVPPTVKATMSDTESHFAAGWKRARPGNPVAGLGQFIVELRDLPQFPFSGAFKAGKIPWKVPIQDVPRLLKNRLEQFRNLGSEYLNIQFGWVPFVSDLRKMYNLWHDIDKRMAKIVRENGKYIRRRATVENETTTSQGQWTYSTAYAYVNGGPANIFEGTGKTWYRLTSTRRERVWFSGSFRYYIPDIGSSEWDRRARLALFGAYPTPELLWNVLPWSWLIDWFANVGDVISNASTNAVDNLTARYSYIMKHVTETIEARVDTYHRSYVSAITDSFVPPPISPITSTFSEESKSRSGGGNPFGLNVSLPSLSGYQLGILAALGISKGALL